MTSSAEQNSQNVESIFNFLYIDQLRLSHIYAQLSNDGLISSSKKTQRHSDKDVFKGGASIGVLKGDYTGESGAESGIEHQIDTSYSRPSDVLNSLWENGFLEEKIKNADLGSMVLVNGSLTLMDFSMLKEMWPAILEMNIKNEAELKSPKDRKAFTDNARRDSKMILELVKHVPHLIQGSIKTEDDIQCWYTLKPDSMLISSGDLMLKHGGKIQGNWYVMGVLDAKPDANNSAIDLSQIGSVAAHLDPMKAGIRQSLGRPINQYGITPILILSVIRKCKS
ncbi:DUF6414 family protein [Undibacterium baiyunense]|uniref:Uncharacterized protein n=1 Tax=Undibacterium baiyunense TaxID=2828731 RepID=A0A941I2F2_9BURK|nr:hypothetical protein [Undibacterium baiyunense]MBR7747428.1 hypothetical protein [Undibacterium baiyunense]